MTPRVNFQLPKMARTYTCEQLCGLYKPGVDLTLMQTEMKWEVVYLSLAAIFTYH